MGDGESIAVDEELAAATKKRPRAGDCDGRDLKRVAEIVMVLAAMGRMRGGNDPTDFEKGLVDEAREKLTEMCASLKPNDLFTSDAARVVAGDLGFNSIKDSVGNRATKRMSIAEKLMLTKKKMEEIKVVTAQPPQQPAPFQPVGVAVKLDNRATSINGSDRPFHDKQSQTPVSANSVFVTASSLTHASTISSSVKQTIFTETPLRPASSSSLSTAVRGDIGHLRPDIRPSGQYSSSSVQANRGLDKTPAIYPTSSVATAITKPSQLKLADHVTAKKFENTPAVNSFQTSKQEFIDQSLKSSLVHPMQGITYGAQQPYHVVAIEQSPSPTVNHGDISRTIQKFLQPKTSEVSNWAPTSVDYMKKTLNCQVCKIGITDLESLLVCDACEKGVHLRCLKSFHQRSVSNIEWHCPKCLLSTNGKPLPPKYGRVTRNIGAPKSASSASGIQVSSEKRNEHDSKSSNQKLVVNSNSDNGSNQKMTVNSNPDAGSNQKMTGCPHPDSSIPSCDHPKVDVLVQPTKCAQSNDSSHCNQHMVDSFNNASDCDPLKVKVSSEDTDYDALHGDSNQCMENSKTGKPTLGSSNLVEMYTSSAEVCPQSCEQSIQNVDGCLQPTPEGAQSNDSSHCDQHMVDSLNKTSYSVPLKVKVVSADTDYDALHDGSNLSMENSKFGSCTMSEPTLGSSNVESILQVDSVLQPTPEGIQSNDSSHCDQHMVNSLNKASNFVPLKIMVISENTDYDALQDGSNQKTQDAEDCILQNTFSDPCTKNSKSGSFITNEPRLESSNEKSDELSTHAVELHTVSAEVCPESFIQSILKVDGDESVIALQKTVSENIYQDISEFTAEETKLQSQLRVMNNSNNVVQNKMMAEFPRELTTENIHQEVDTCANDETKVPYESGKTSDIFSEVVEDSKGDSYVATINTGSERSKHAESQSAYMHGVEWVGAVIDTVDDKTYYQSCCINGLVYKLQDTVMASIDHRVFPSKIQALWEDNKNGPKWATLTKLYYASDLDLPEVITRPSTTESDEVYESNDYVTVEASCINGQCVVLTFSKFQEESQQSGGEKSLDPVFRCRWFYDKSKSFFQPLTD